MEFHFDIEINENPLLVYKIATDPNYHKLWDKTAMHWEIMEVDGQQFYRIEYDVDGDPTIVYQQVVSEIKGSYLETYLYMKYNSAFGTLRFSETPQGNTCVNYHVEFDFENKHPYSFLEFEADDDDDDWDDEDLDETGWDKDQDFFEDEDLDGETDWDDDSDSDLDEDLDGETDWDDDEDDEFFEDEFDDDELENALPPQKASFEVIDARDEDMEDILAHLNEQIERGQEQARQELEHSLKEVLVKMKCFVEAQLN